MIIIFSPAKTFDENDHLPQTTPHFMHEAKYLHHKLSLIDDVTLKKQMHLSDHLLNEVKSYIHTFDQKKMPALFTYKGQAYKSLDVSLLNEKALTYLNNHLYILSGLYGLLKPTDGICFYRLEAKDKTLGNLYTFWKSKLTSYIHTYHKDEIIVNLASIEYDQMIDESLPMIRFEFLKKVDQTYKKQAMHIKTMRGKFLRYLAQHQMTSLEHMKHIIIDGYTYDVSLSDEKTFVYVLEEK